LQSVERKQPQIIRQIIWLAECNNTGKREEGAFPYTERNILTVFMKLIKNVYKLFEGDRVCII